MRRRELLKYAAATAVAGSLGPRIARAADPVVVKVGVVGPKTGPLAPGAAVTHFPNFKLWAYEVNQRGGLKLKDGLHKVELIEYDDRTPAARSDQGGGAARDRRQSRFHHAGLRHRVQSRGRADLCQVQLSADHAGLRHRPDRAAYQALPQHVHRPGLDHGVRHLGHQRPQEAEGRRTRSATRSR